jgi:hypothetical protein
METAAALSDWGLLLVVFVQIVGLLLYLVTSLGSVSNFESLFNLNINIKP